MADGLEQCVILAGGAGSRLGELTRSTPKPMLDVAGRPFIEHLLRKASKLGFRRALILGGAHAHVIDDWLAAKDFRRSLGLGVTLSTEPRPLGTGGALSFARRHLDDAFLLLNGDTWFDFNWRLLAAAPEPAWCVALRSIDDASRYETVTLKDGRIEAFAPRSGLDRPGLINGGVYLGRRDLVPSLHETNYSLESELLPELCAEGRLRGRAFEGAFIDIGVPAALNAAQLMLD